MDDRLQSFTLLNQTLINRERNEIGRGTKVLGRERERNKQLVLSKAGTGVRRTLGTTGEEMLLNVGLARPVGLSQVAAGGRGETTATWAVPYKDRSVQSQAAVDTNPGEPWDKGGVVGGRS